MDMQLIGFLGLGSFVSTSIFHLPLKNLCMHWFSYVCHGYHEKLFKLSVSHAVVCICLLLCANQSTFFFVFIYLLLGIYMINDFTRNH